MAYMALREAYENLASEEMMHLIPIAIENLPGDLRSSLVEIMLSGVHGKARETYLEKMNRSYERYRARLAELKGAGYKFLRYGWKIEEDPL